jgi:EthD domain
MTSDAVTLVIPLRKKESISAEDFYDYWLNAHVTLPPRFPGISSIWLHAVSFDSDSGGSTLWPQIAGVSNRPAPEDEFHGVPEATFPTMEDLGAFQAASRVQMEDGINFLSEQLAFVSVQGSTETVVDHTDKAPDGSDDLVRHLVFLRARPEAAGGFRSFVTGDLAPAWASAPGVRKVKRHLFEPLDITLDHPGVLMFKPPERQYHACVEVVAEDAEALAALPGLVPNLAAKAEAVHAARVERCVTTKIDGRITLAGVRGIAVADVIRRLDAKSQRDADVSELFLRNDAPSLT